MNRPSKDHGPRPAAFVWQQLIIALLTIAAAFLIGTSLFPFVRQHTQLIAQRDSLSSAQSELNVRLTSLETELSQLNAELASTYEAREEEMSQLDHIVAALRDSLVDAELRGSTIRIELPEAITFERGEAELKESAKSILLDIRDQLTDTLGFNIRVEGHADTVAIHNERFPSNWELSAQRASSVVRYLSESLNIDPRRLEAVGRGQYSPIDPGTTEAALERNRRVELYLLPDFAREYSRGRSGVEP